MQFDHELHNIWSILYKKQLPGTRKYACTDNLEGFDLLNLPEGHIPSVDFLNGTITPRT